MLRPTTQCEMQKNGTQMSESLEHIRMNKKYATIHFSSFLFYISFRVTIFALIIVDSFIFEIFIATLKLILTEQ